MRAAEAEPSRPRVQRRHGERLGFALLPGQVFALHQIERGVDDVEGPRAAPAPEHAWERRLEDEAVEDDRVAAGRLRLGERDDGRIELDAGGARGGVEALVVQ